MRSQPLDIRVERLEAQDVVDYAFGTAYKGLHTVWKFEFSSEHSNVFTNNDDSVYFLKQDCNRIAFTPYLDESVNFLTNIFDTKSSEHINLYFIKSV